MQTDKDVVLATACPRSLLARPRSLARRKLTARRREMLQLLAEGGAMKEIADLLRVSERTVAFHKYTIMGRLGVKTSAELVQYALEQGKS